MHETEDGIHILHVDDEPDFLELTATYLTREDDRFTIDTATSAADALDQLSELAVDCIISDYDMPGRNGIEFLRAVRENHPDRPFILYTGQGSEGVASDAISAGVTDYLEKETGTEQYAVLANRIRNTVERYRAEKARAASERRLRDVYERITDGFYAVNSDWEFTYINEAGARLVDRDPTELLDERVWDVFPNLSDSPFEDALRTAMDTQQTTSADAYYPPHSTWYAVTVYPDPDGISIFFRDITDTKARDRPVSQAETIFEHTQDAIFLIEVTDDEFRYERVNDAYTQQTGLDRAAVEGQSLVDVVGEDNHEAVHARYRECVESREPMEYDEVLPIGEGIHWHTKIAPVIEDGEVTHLVGATREISERKERERELERYEAIVENSEDGIYIFDADGTFEFVNQRVETVSGIPREAWIGEHVSIHTDLGTMTADEVGAIQDGIDAILEEGADDVRIELSPDIPSDVRVLELRLTAFPTADETERVIGFTRDITERKHHERALQRRNERLDEFASVVSHDLRNPLGVATGRLEQAREAGDDEDLAAVAQALDRMEALIENLLALSREGERVRELEAVSLAEVVGECWQTIETGDATLSIGTDQVVMADVTAVRQLLENLMANAVEHGGESVTVTVGALSDGFYVADDGCGLREGEHEQVFEAGYSTSESGMGFGLCIVEEIVDAHGWSVAVSESESGGARFEIRGVEPG